MRPMVVLAVVAILLAACGRKGDPVAPSADGSGMRPGIVGN
ncbi:MAG: hypothetical protein KatS3mg118_2155 [Paracoccaceae bacterium]|nr:MAG: hypothetical protein KatS3mg118_2155 [Paracoccaceae bacterium]